ncbi:MAG: metallophosphoesterase [Chloroherpetonaceae bacterium]
MKKLLFTILIFVLFSNFLWSKIIMQPYLQAVTDSSIAILVESDSPEPIEAKYSIASSSATQLTAKSQTYKVTDNSTKTYIHRIYLKNLASYSNYTYSVSDNTTKYQGKFITAPSDDSKDFTFAIMGDCRSQTKIHSKIADDIAQKEPNFSIYLGDLCFSPSYSAWKDEFFIPSELNLIANVPFANAIGNHEDSKPNTYAFTQSPDIANSEDLGYFDFYYGPVHFIILNTEVNISTNSKQYKFIKNALENSKGKFKIVAMHIPPYVAGGHGENGKLITISEKLFVPNKVDIVLAGDSHFYQHNLVNGVHHLIIAGGGAPLYTPKSKDYTLNSAKAYCYGIAKYSNNALTLEVYDINNNLLDTIQIKK